MLKKIVNCNQAQYNSLVSTGSAVIGGQTVPFDPIGDQHQVEYIEYVHTLRGFFSVSSSNEMHGSIIIKSDVATPITYATLNDNIGRVTGFSLVHSDHGTAQHVVTQIGSATNGMNVSTFSVESITFNWAGLNQSESVFTDTVTTI